MKTKKTVRTPKRDVPAQTTVYCLLTAWRAFHKAFANDRGGELSHVLHHIELTLVGTSKHAAEVANILLADALNAIADDDRHAAREIAFDLSTHFNLTF